MNITKGIDIIKFISLGQLNNPSININIIMTKAEIKQLPTKNYLHVLYLDAGRGVQAPIITTIATAMLSIVPIQDI